MRALILNENTAFGDETAAGIMRNRCAFTPKDMAAEFDSAFTYAIVLGWGDAMDEIARTWGWDAALVDFIRDASARFDALPDKVV